MKELYVLISWPEIQDFMEHERWEECIFCQEIEGHPCPDSTYKDILVLIVLMQYR